MSNENCDLGQKAGLGAEIPGRLTYTVEQAGRLLGICRNTAYRLATENQLPTIRLGRRLFVPKAALDRLLDPTRT
jgi:excisionase family DNA binding protein